MKRREVRAYILDDKHRLLMLQDSEGMWDLPGAVVDANETSHNALKRSMKEQLSFDVVSCCVVKEISEENNGILCYLQYFGVMSGIFSDSKSIKLDDGVIFEWFTAQNMPCAEKIRGQVSYKDAIYAS